MSALDVMRTIENTAWDHGDGPNSDIANWLRSISAKYPEMAAYCNSVIHAEYFEWCGMTIAYCMAQSDIRPVFGRLETEKFLYALAWLEWGEPIQTPNPGDVVVFDFGGGRHHVTLFVEDVGNGYWNCMGGNQTHTVKTSKFPRSSVRGIRRPV